MLDCGSPLTSVRHAVASSDMPRPEQSTNCLLPPVPVVAGKTMTTTTAAVYKKGDRAVYIKAGPHHGDEVTVVRVDPQYGSLARCYSAKRGLELGTEAWFLAPFAIEHGEGDNGGRRKGTADAAAKAAKAAKAARADAVWTHAAMRSDGDTDDDMLVMRPSTCAGRGGQGTEFNDTAAGTTPSSHRSCSAGCGAAVPTVATSAAASSVEKDDPTMQRPLRSDTAAAAARLARSVLNNAVAPSPAVRSPLPFEPSRRCNRYSSEPVPFGSTQSRGRRNGDDSPLSFEPMRSRGRRSGDCAASAPMVPRVNAAPAPLVGTEVPDQAASAGLGLDKAAGVMVTDDGSLVTDDGAVEGREANVADSKPASATAGGAVSDVRTTAVPVATPPAATPPPKPPRMSPPRADHVRDQPAPLTSEEAAERVLWLRDGTIVHQRERTDESPPTASAAPVTDAAPAALARTDAAEHDAAAGGGVDLDELVAYNDAAMAASELADCGYTTDARPTAALVATASAASPPRTPPPPHADDVAREEAVERMRVWHVKVEADRMRPTLRVPLAIVARAMTKVAARGDHWDIMDEPGDGWSDVDDGDNLDALRNELADFHKHSVIPVSPPPPPSDSLDKRRHAPSLDKGPKSAHSAHCHMRQTRSATSVCRSAPVATRAKQALMENPRCVSVGIVFEDDEGYDEGLNDIDNEAISANVLIAGEAHYDCVCLG